MKTHVVGTELICVEKQTDRQTAETFMTKLTDAFCSCFVNASKYG